MPDVLGMHNKGLSKEAKARRNIKNLRNKNRVPVEFKDNTVHHMPCSSYKECNHKKHSTPRGTTKH